MRRDPFFAGPGLDRADSLRADPARLQELVSNPLARELVWDSAGPAIGADGRLQWRELTDSALFLGLAGDGSPRFCALQDIAGDVRAALSMLGNLSDEEGPLFAAALSLARWHCSHRFCPACGNESAIGKGGWSRRCSDCEAEHFPRVDPVVIMLAEHVGRILLGRQYHYPPGRYSALAGFLEVGETIEDAVRRELREEAGIEVADIFYVASQPWPFPSSLMIGCTARSLRDSLEVDYTELEDARWFTRGEVEAALDEAAGAAFQAPPRHAIARTLLERWVAA